MHADYQKLSVYIPRLWKEQFAPLFSEGLIVTPFALINEILDKLPVDWSNPALTFLDPCCGSGRFLMAIKYRLLDAGHSEQHIIEHMIYGCDVDPVNITGTLDMLGAKVYNHNIKCTNSLTEKWTMKFDVVIGNPPYSENNTGKGGNADLYQRFGILALQLGKVVAFVTPGTFKRQEKFEPLRSAMNARGVCTIQSIPVDTFPGATIDDPTYWVVGKGTRTVQEIVSDEHDFLLSTLNLTNEPRRPWRGGQAPVCNSTHAVVLSATQTPTHLYPYVDRVRTTGPVFVHATTKLWKTPIPNGVVIPQRSGDTPTVCYIPTPFAHSQNVLACECSKEEAENFQRNAQLSLTRYLLRVSARVVRGVRNAKNQPYPHTSGSLSSLIPAVLFTKTWTDAELYAHFNLTQEEIDLIESTVK